IDATLGVEGLPQSGTGQATLLTGVNCARLAGRHYGPYPHSATRATIAAKNVFRQIQERFPDEAEPVAFANAYPDRFFRYAARRDWWTVTTRCCLDASVRIRTAADLRRGDALSADITGAGWPQPDSAIEPVTEEVAASRLAASARKRRFTLYEYYLTDKAGHARDHERAAGVLESLDRFFGGLANAVDDRGTILVSSDHGNLEDLSVKPHTLNPVPLLVRGPLAPFFRDVSDLTGVTPAIVEALSQTPP
ncbi:MAG TPA: alkaline phosphatase family protein, partial [Rhodothermales bacterium]